MIKYIQKQQVINQKDATLVVESDICFLKVKQYYQLQIVMTIEEIGNLH